jgi:predicted DNA-binding mobile mystery protein A
MFDFTSPNMARRPIRGWIHSIRSGLGISGVQMAQKMGVQPPRIIEMEKGELDGALTLKTLERAAEAMGYCLIYALVPKVETLEGSLSSSSQVDTLLTDQEVLELRNTHIKTRNALQLWETDGIHHAEAWAWKKKPKDLLSQRILLRLHQKMFGAIWKEVGKFRMSQGFRNQTAQADGSLDANSMDIAIRVESLFENARYWQAAKSYPAEEAGARFYCRMLAIQPFQHGSESIARLMTDLMLEILYYQPRFTWGVTTYGLQSDCEEAKLKALRSAEGRDFGPMIAWARS